MGFSAIAARPSQDAALAGLVVWARRADAAIMHVSVPYKAMRAGTTAADSWTPSWPKPALAVWDSLFALRHEP